MFIFVLTESRLFYSMVPKRTNFVPKQTNSFWKKKQVFTLGAENEQKFGAVNGCRNWWTPYKFIAPIGEKLASKSKLGDKWSKRKKMSLTSFTRHHLFFQVKIFYQSWNKKKFRIPSLSHALFYSATSMLEHMKS